MLFFNFWLINVIFFFFLYFDLKFRKIPNSSFFFFFFISILLNYIDILLFYRNVYKLAFLRSFFLLVVFTISILLFTLKIIGGSDGKLIILTFLNHPINFLNFNFIGFFFLIFSLLFVLIFIINLTINNKFKKAYSFIVYFNLNYNYSFSKKFFIKIFYNFINISKIVDYNEDRNKIKSLDLIYNYNTKKIQILTQYRPPLIGIYVICYYLTFLIII